MLWIDRFEKFGRLLLWLTIASVLLALSLAHAKQRRGEAELREALQKANAQLAEALKPKRPARLMFSSMGPVLYGLNQATATGHLSITNVSTRAGVVCVFGMAKNPETQKTTESMPACHEVGAYASAIRIAVEFASGDLANVCGKTKCELEIRDVPQTPAEEAAGETNGAQTSPLHIDHATEGG